MAKDYDRSEAARKGWVTRRANQGIKVESIIPKLKELNPQNVSGYSKRELLDIAKRGNLAVSARENEFRRKYKEETGVEYTGSFNREDFRVSKKSTLGRLRHVVIMQKKFLERKNTFEEFKQQVEQFERRVRARMSVLETPEKEGEEKLSLGEKLQKRENESTPELTLLEQDRFKKRFFKLYEKALEAKFGGAESSKGSPIFAKVGEFMLENRNITLRELLKKLEEWDEGVKLSEKGEDKDDSGEGTSQEDLITTAVSRNNNK